MKKFITILLVIMMAVCLISCNEQETIETTTPQIPPEEIKVSIINSGNTMCETPTRIVYVCDMETYYYNKLDGNTYTFCFDPLCKHGTSCLSNKFKILNDAQPMRYREEDNRLYALRGSKLISFAFDGSDVKFLYSYGGEDDWSSRSYNSGLLRYMEINGDYIYLTIQNAETGNREMHRYDIESGTMENLMKNTDVVENITAFMMNEDTIYFWGNNQNGNGFYSADLKFKNIQKISGDDGSGYYSPDSLFDGKTFYVPIQEEVATNKFVTKEIRTYHVDTKEETLLCKMDIEGWIDIFSLSDRYLYYTINNPTVIGQKKSGTGRISDVKTYQYNIYRYDMETGEHLAVFYDLNYDINSIFLMEDSVLMEGMLYTKSGENLTSESHMFVADIDENGMFVNVRILEE